MLALQREAQRVAQTRGGHRVLLAAPAGELHVVALRMVDNLLRDAGYDVAMLGADVPTEALATLGEPPPAARRLPDLDDARRGRRGAGGDRRSCSADGLTLGFVIGGGGLASRGHSRPGIDVCRRVSDAVEAVDAMIRGGGRN